jgi:hypothetical protein
MYAAKCCSCVAVLALVLAMPSVSAYCWQPGRNPSFTAPPLVEQVSVNHLRVVWSDGIISRRECADQFLVKFW